MWRLEESCIDWKRSDATQYKCCWWAHLSTVLGARGAEERHIEPNINCLGVPLCTVDCLGGASSRALSLVCVEFSTYNHNTALGECEDGLECGYHVGWFWVARGRAACNLVLVYMSIRLSQSKWVRVNRETQHHGQGTTSFSFLIITE